MTIISNIVNQIFEILGEDSVNILKNITDNIACDYSSYCFFINSNYNTLLLFKKISKKQQLLEKISLVNEKIHNAAIANNIQDFILFLNLIKTYMINFLNKKLYLPKLLNETTKNNLISFVKKDLNEQNIQVLEIDINKFCINTIVYVFLPDILITYSISNFLIKIIKKDLDVTHE